MKNIWLKIFYRCKIISSKTGSYQNFHKKFFGRKFFMVVKSFPRKQVPTKIFLSNFFMVTSFPQKQVPIENIHQTLFSRNFFMVAKSFPRKQVPTRNFRQNFLYGGKINSSKTGSYQKFSSVIFARKFFIVAKSFPRKQVPTKNFHRKVSSRKIFL